MEYNLRHNADIVHLAQLCGKELDSTPLKIYFAKIYGDDEFLNTLVYPKIDQKVKRDYKESWDYWVSEVEAELGRVLIRTTESKDDPQYDDFWVSVKELVFDKEDAGNVRKTYNNELIHYSKLSQQHLSNIIWFNKIFWNDRDSPEEEYELNERFDGKILPYRPAENWGAEIDFLRRMDMIKEDGTIEFEGKIIGEVVTEHQD